MGPRWHVHVHACRHRRSSTPAAAALGAAWESPLPAPHPPAAVASFPHTRSARKILGLRLWPSPDGSKAWDHNVTQASRGWAAQPWQVWGCAASQPGQLRRQRHGQAPGRQRRLLPSCCQMRAALRKPGPHARWVRWGAAARLLARRHSAPHPSSLPLPHPARSATMRCCASASSRCLGGSRAPASQTTQKPCRRSRRAVAMPFVVGGRALLCCMLGMRCAVPHRAVLCCALAGRQQPLPLLGRPSCMRMQHRRRTARCAARVLTQRPPVARPACFAAGARGVRSIPGQAAPAVRSWQDSGWRVWSHDAGGSVPSLSLLLFLPPPSPLPLRPLPLLHMPAGGTASTQSNLSLRATGAWQG